MPALDIRLLEVFDALHRTGSVTRAAESLGLGQPAVSIALGRLREHYGEPLFVRTAGGMQPTPLADRLKAPIRQALEAVMRVDSVDNLFDPTTSERCFRIAMTDISQLVLLPPLWARLRVSAPTLRLEILPLTSAVGTMLEEGSADLALGYVARLDARVYQQTLFRQSLICMVSADHPTIRDRLTRADFEAADHAATTLAGTGHQFLDREIERLGIRRHIAIRIPNFVGMALAIEQTDLLVTIPRRLGEMLAGHGRFRMFPVPFPLPDYAVRQHWHERFHHDPGNRWLRELIAELLSAPRPSRGMPPAARTARPSSRPRPRSPRR